jgi:flagellar M-ring protein FliF
MPEQLQKIIQPIKTRWDALTRDQKIKLVATSLVVLLALLLTAYLVFRTQYEIFINNLSASEIMPIETALTGEGIRHKRENNGTALAVDKNRIVDAKIAIESNPDVQGVNFTFADALANAGMGTTETMKRSMLIQAKQTDLAKDLTRYSGVISASVNLHIPEPIRLLVQNDQKSRATAILQVSRPLSKDEGLAIARFLSRSIEGLEMDDIEITDQNFNIVFSGLQETANISLNSVSEFQNNERQQLIRDLTRLFSPMYDEVYVIPQLAYDNVTRTIQESIIHQAPQGNEEGLVELERSSRSQVQGASSPDEPGLGANNQQVPGYQTGDAGNYRASQSDMEVSRALDTTRRQEEFGPSSYIRPQSSITAHLNKHIIYDQQKMEQNDRSFTQADWDELVRTADVNIITEGPVIEARKQSVAVATGINIDNVDLVINEIPIFYPYMRTPITPQQIIMLSVLALLILMLAYGLLRRHKQTEEEEEMEPELSVEDLLVSTQLEEAKEEAAAAQLEEIDYFKESEVKKQIEKFVNEKPEAVASLLRNWINAEEW